MTDFIEGLAKECQTFACFLLRVLSSAMFMTHGWAKL
jgi:uncharacterized membrane protein YphA (DoxX/SURF4 family)